MKFPSQSRGISLLELVIALGLMAALALVAFGLVQVGRNMAATTMDLAQVQRDVRLASDRFCDELRWGTRVTLAGADRVLVEFDAGSPYHADAYELELEAVDRELVARTIVGNDTAVETWSRSVASLTFIYYDDSGNVVLGDEPDEVAGIELELQAMIGGSLHTVSGVAWLRNRR